MAETGALTDLFCSIDGNDLSSFVVSVNANYRPELQDDTAMGDTARSNAAGLIVDTVTFVMNQDFAAGATPHGVLFALLGAAGVEVEYRPTSAARSASNPGFVETMVISDYQPFTGGGVGEQAQCSVMFENADGAKTTAEVA